MAKKKTTRTRSKTLGYSVLLILQRAAEQLAKEHRPKEVARLVSMVNRAYAVWNEVAERRHETRKDTK